MNDHMNVHLGLITFHGWKPSAGESHLFVPNSQFSELGSQLSGISAVAIISLSKLPSSKFRLFDPSKQKTSLGPAPPHCDCSAPDCHLHSGGESLSAIDTNLSVFYQNPPQHCHSTNTPKFLKWVLFPEELHLPLELQGTTRWKTFTRTLDKYRGEGTSSELGHDLTWPSTGSFFICCL